MWTSVLSRFSRPIYSLVDQMDGRMTLVWVQLIGIGSSPIIAGDPTQLAHGNMLDYVQHFYTPQSRGAIRL